MYTSENGCSRAQKLTLQMTHSDWSNLMTHISWQHVLTGKNEWLDNNDLLTRHSLIMCN